jgi:hypothetical protein
MLIKKKNVKQQCEKSSILFMAITNEQLELGIGNYGYKLCMNILKLFASLQCVCFNCSVCLYACSNSRMAEGISMKSNIAEFHKHLSPHFSFV